LAELAQPVPRTHDLEDLLGLLLASYSQLAPLRRGLKFLIQFAVEARYPGFQASKKQAMAALRWAGRVRDACRRILGIRPPRRRK
jgi:HEPN domain-containing protein